METIVDLIETRLNNKDSNCSFTFLDYVGEVNSAVSLHEIRKTACKFTRMLPEKTTVLILLPQGISFISAFFGCLYARSIAVPAAVPTKNRGLDKLKSIISDAEIRFGITNKDTFENLRKWFEKDEALFRVHWLLIEDIEREHEDFLSPPKLPKADQIAFLQYTSGSTGNPKGVIIRHKNIIANSKIIQACFQNTPDSVSVCWLPSFHDMGLIDGIVQPIFAGFQSILMSPVHFLQKPVRWFKAITEFKATYSGGPNFAFDLCYDRIKDDELTDIDLSGLRCLYNGSEPIRRSTMRKFVERFSSVGISELQLFTCYGLAEATLAVTASKLGTAPTVIKVDEKSLEQNLISLAESGVEIVGSGAGYFDSDVKIFEPNTSKECGEQVIGEICVSGNSVSSGYLNRASATAKTFMIIAGRKFLRTGDLGFLLGNELFVTGRIKDLIIINGANHYPQDIEQTVTLSHNALQANGCAAFSVEVDNEEKLVVGQELKRVFRRSVDYSSILDKILEQIGKKHGVVPFDIFLVAPNSIPRTTSGKIQRGECRRMWRSEEFQSLATLREYIFRVNTP